MGSRRGGPSSGASAFSITGGPISADAFGAQRAPSPTRLVETYKQLVYTMATLNAMAVVRTPLRLYGVTMRGQAAPRWSIDAPRRSYASVDPARLRQLRELPYCSRMIQSAENVDEVTEHQLLDLLDNPNSEFDRHQLLLYTCLSLDIVGSAYQRPTRDAGLIPSELWPLEPHYVEPIRQSGQAVVSGYRYFGQSFKPEELIRYRWVGLRDAYGPGYSPAQAAYKYSGLEDKYVSIEDQVLGLGPRPGMLISPSSDKMPWGDAEKDRFVADLNRSTNGPNAGKAVATTVPVKVTPMTYPPSDISGEHLAHFNLERMAGCFGVPVAYLTGETNLANLQAAERQHSQAAVMPRCELIASALTRQLAHKCDPRLFFAFDPVLVDDEKQQADVDKVYVDMGAKTRNEVRANIGLPPIEGGDVATIAGATIRVQDAAKKPEPIPAPNAPGAAPTATKKPKPKGDAKAVDEAKAKRLLDALARLIADDEREDGTPPFGQRREMPPRAEGHSEENTYGLPDGEPIASELKIWFSQQLTEVLGSIPPEMVEPPRFFPPLTDYDDPMAAAMTPLISAYWKESGDQTLGRLEAATGLDLGTWEVVNPFTREKIHQAAMAFCKVTNRTTSLHLNDALDKLRSELVEGIVDKGDTLVQLRKRVNGVFDHAEKWRAQRIAASEASRAVHQAQLAADMESGVVAGSEWLLSGDACPYCMEVAERAKQVPLGQAFAIIGHNPDYSVVHAPPLHPLCQCSMLEVLMPEYGGPELPQWALTVIQPKGEPPSLMETPATLVDVHSHPTY